MPFGDPNQAGQAEREPGAFGRSERVEQGWIYDFRFALGRAEIAARAAFPGHTVERETISALIGRLVVRPA